LLVTFANDSDQKVVHVHLSPWQGECLTDAATCVYQHHDQQLGSTLIMGLWFPPEHTVNVGWLEHGEYPRWFFQLRDF
jgi:hypothetical protein